MTLLEIHSPLRHDSSDSITLCKSFFEACKSDKMSIFVDALNVWHERLQEVGFERAAANDNAVKHEATTQPESRAWERIQSLIQPAQNANQNVIFGHPCNDVGGRLTLCTVKRAEVSVHLILPGEIVHYIRKVIESDQPAFTDIVGTQISEVLNITSSMEIGAHDFVTRRADPSQLAIQFEESLIGREKPTTPIATYTFGECEIDFAKMTARRAGRPIAVTTLECKLLKYFMDNSERVLSRAELLDEVWGYNCYPTTRSVDSLILKLRKKLESNPTKPRHLHTVYGAGYKFVP